MTKPTLPDVSHLPTNPDEVVFKPHPDGCGTVCYGNEFFFALIGGKNGCKCVAEYTAIILDTLCVTHPQSFERKVYFEQTFESQEAAVAAAQQWLAEKHTELRGAIEKLKELKEKSESPAQSQSTRTAFVDRIRDPEIADIFLASAANTGKGKKPINNEPKGFAFPLFNKQQKFES